jgi:hypothetical protein
MFIQAHNSISRSNHATSTLTEQHLKPNERRGHLDITFTFNMHIILTNLLRLQSI